MPSPSRHCVQSVLALLLLVLGACSSPTDDGGSVGDDSGSDSPDVTPQLPRINLPDGFTITVWASDVPNARSLEISPQGLVFVGSRNAGTVYALADTDDDHVADRIHVIDENLTTPNGVAFRDGALFVAERSRILRYDDIENRLDDPPDPVVVYAGYPGESTHGWKYIAFGPDGKLYVPVGAPCNVCEEDDPFASITRMNPDGSGVEVIARGVRNSVGFDWDPLTGDFWFTDNGRDHLGDDLPPCELNHLTEVGQHFGFPHFHAGTIPDPDFSEGHDPSEFRYPAQTLGPHVAPLGMEFYDGTQFPAEYRDQIFIAEHGSWNRSEKIGYRISLVGLDGNREAVSYETFASGWLQPDEEVWGRPVDLELMADGSMLVSDDESGSIYRIAYTGN